jgi:hypothetical protein
MTDIEVKLKLISTLSQQVRDEVSKVKGSFGDASGLADKFQSSFSKMANDVGSSWSGMVKNIVIGWATVEGVMKLKQMISSSIQWGAEIENTSRKMGLSTTEFQKSSYVWKQSGGNFENMGRAFSTMSKEAMKSNEILGVSTRDSNGHLKDQGELFEELLLRISEIPNPTERMAASMKVFGMAGREVFNIASQGKDRIHELMEETNKYGLILDKNTIKALDDARKSTELCNTAMKVAGANMTVAFTPAIITLSHWAAIAAKSLNDLDLSMGFSYAHKDINILDDLKAKMAAFKADKFIDIAGGSPKALAELKAYEMQIAAYEKIAATKKISPASSAASQFDDLAEKTGKEKSELPTAALPYQVEAELQEQRDKQWKKGEEAQKQNFDFNKKQIEAETKLGEDEYKAFQEQYKKIAALQHEYQSPEGKIKTEDAAKIKMVASADPEILNVQQKQALILKITKQADDQIKKEKMKAIADQVSLYAGMAQQVISIANNMAQAQINGIESNKQAETDAVEHSHMSAKAKQKALEKIDKEAQEKERGIKKQQQEWSIASALVSGAEGVAKIWATYAAMPVLAGIMTALEVGVVASQIAVIASQKFATGLEAGPVRQVTGTGGTDSQAIRATPGEVVATPGQLLALTRGSTTSNATTHHYHMGDIVIQGSAGPAAVQQIRRTQQQQIRDLRDLMRAGQRMRQLA